jgi:DNA-binding response OmpR family regulator
MTVPSSKLEFLPGTTDQPDWATSRILLEDDNADLRDYVARLLRSQGWTVDAVTDGLTALADGARACARPRAHRRHDAGARWLRTLRELRNDPRTANVPVVVLSARAGEESRVEGAASGADDYLVKPFSAQELVARVGVHLRLARQRRDTELAPAQPHGTVRDAAQRGPVRASSWCDGNLRIREVNPVALPAFADIPDLIGRDLDEIVHIQWSAEYADEIVSCSGHTLETASRTTRPSESRSVAISE